MQRTKDLIYDYTDTRLQCGSMNLNSAIWYAKHGLLENANTKSDLNVDGRTSNNTHDPSNDGDHDGLANDEFCHDDDGNFDGHGLDKFDGHGHAGFDDNGHGIVTIQARHKSSY